MSLIEIPSSSELVGPHYKNLSEAHFERSPTDNEEKEDFFSQVLKENLEILDQIKIPNRFDRKQIEERFTRRITEDLKEAPLIKTEEKIDKYTKAINRYFQKYFEEIYDHVDNLIDSYQGKILMSSRDFLNSDLPPSFLRTVSLSFKTEQKFFEIYKKKIKKEEFHLKLNCNNQKKFNRIVEQHNGWVDRLNPFLDDMAQQCIALLWYVNIWNSKSLDELFEEKTYKMSSLDRETFESMLVQLESMIKEVRKRLISLDKEEFVKKLDSRDPTIALFSSSVEAFTELIP
jgi:hypothetical protein